MRYFEMKGIFRFLSGIMGITWLLWGGCRPTIKEHDQSLSDITVIDLNTLEEADLLLSHHRVDSLRKFAFQGHVMTVADGWPDSLRVIKLETSADCLLGAIKKIRFVDSLIFISDYNDHLYVFDSSGSFRNPIGELGRAPNQVVALSSFYVDRKRKVVGVYDGYSDCIHRYTFDGIKQDKISCRNEVNGYILDVNQIDDNEILLTLSSGVGDLYNYAVVSAKDYKLKEYILPYNLRYLENSSRGELSCLAQPNGQLWLTALLSDTIYEYKAGKMLSRFVVKSDCMSLNDRVFESHKEWISPAHASAFLRDNGYSQGLMAIWATDQYLQFDLSYKDAGYSVYYDYLNHKGYKSKQYSRGNVLMPGRFLTTTSDAFVSYVTAYDFIHQPEGCIDVDRPLWRDLRERTMEDDNPILLLYYIRK
nr:6-bladed beta-propeller [Odoribacter splanchnicus]